MVNRKPYPSDKADKFLVRMPDGLRHEIRREATANRRTMNAEIIFQLERGMTARSHIEKADAQ